MFHIARAKSLGIVHGQTSAQVICYNVTNLPLCSEIAVPSQPDPLPFSPLAWALAHRLALVAAVLAGLWAAVAWALDWWS
jgi:hypothetical protein